MKRLLLCLSVAVSFVGSIFADEERKITSVQYWIDNQQDTPTVSSSTEFTINCAELPPGLHTLHYRIADNAGKYSPLQEHIFYKVAPPKEAPKVASVEYWIDDLQDTPIVNSTTEFTVNCSDLSAGLHTLHYMVVDSNGTRSPLQEHGFYKLDVVQKATKVKSLQYWWDDQHENAVVADYTSDEFVLSTNDMSKGLHSLQYRVLDDTGRWSDLRSHYFYKGEPSDIANIVSYTFWWNDMPDLATTKILETPATAIEIDEDMNVPEEARTSYAGHYTATLHFIVKDNYGRTSYVSTNVEYPDNDAPVTDIDADKYVATSSVKLTWIESSGDKMGDYNVYFSKDNGPFILWLPDTKQTSATFKGERGSVYVFTVTGRDSFGNREKYDETKCVSVTFE